MIGGTGLNLRISGVDWDMYEFYLMFLTREINIKLFQNYTKAYIYIRFCIRFVVLNRPYSTNTQAIWKNVISEEPEKLKFADYYLNLIFFLFLIDIIDNIIYASGTCHQNSNQW